MQTYTLELTNLTILIGLIPIIEMELIMNNEHMPFLS